MQTVVHEDRLGGRSDRDVDLLVEKGFLLLGSIEFQIDQHLMSHGTRIGPETRVFMAQVRDVAGDAATRMLDEARTRAEAASADRAPASADARTATEGSAGPPLAQAKGSAPRARPAKPAGRRWLVSGRTAAHLGLGTALAALIAALLVVEQMPAGTQPQASGGADTAAIGQAVPAIAPSAAPQRAGDAAAAEAVAADQGGALTVYAATAVGERMARPEDGASEGVAAGVTKDDARAIRSDAWSGSGPDARPETRTKAADAPAPAAARPFAAALAAMPPRPAKSAIQPPYPDPRAGPADSAAQLATAAAAAAEARLALSPDARREVQRRLTLARFDPHLVDGIFGPATRAALGGWQRAPGLPVTEYLDAPALALLRERTAEAYRALVAEEARAQRLAHRRAVRTHPVPAVGGGRCPRSSTGRIAYGQGVRCDLRGLRENIARLFG